jgi:hypothetical protein
MRYSRNIFAISAAAFGVSLPTFVFAARDIPLQISILSHETVTNLAEYVGILYQYLVGIAGIIAVAMIMYGGMKWIFAGGDSGKITQSKEVISHAIIGLVLALGSFVILNTINPALIDLKVPDVGSIGAVRLAEQWCPNAGEFQGQFDCGQTYNLPAGGDTVGRCLGAHCGPGQGGCFPQYDPSGKSIERYSCFDTAACPDNCSLINESRFGSNWISYCRSTVCGQQLPRGCRVHSGQCIGRQGNGGFCGNDSDCALDCDAEGNCQSNLWCYPDEFPDRCRPRAGAELAAGLNCGADIHCASGVCNLALRISRCVAESGGRADDPCGRDEECAGLRGDSLLICHTIDEEIETSRSGSRSRVEVGGVCVFRRSIDRDEYCNRNDVCQSNRCEDNKCVAP